MTACGRKLPVISFNVAMIERPLLGKAAVQFWDSEKNRGRTSGLHLVAAVDLLG